MSTPNLSSILECTICYDAFDSSNKRPRVLSCGHTFCSVCLQKLINAMNTINCPTCKQNHDKVVMQVEDVTVNFMSLHMMEAFGHDSQLGDTNMHRSLPILDVPSNNTPSRTSRELSVPERMLAEKKARELRRLKFAMRKNQTENATAVKKIVELKGFEAENDRRINELKDMKAKVRKERKQQEEVRSYSNNSKLELEQLIQRTNDVQTLEEMDALTQTITEMLHSAHPAAPTRQVEIPSQQRSPIVAIPTRQEVVFLEITWADVAQGRVYIRVFNNSLRGQQFLLLCTGENGPTYKGNKFLKIGNIGLKNEFIQAGDYEYNSGKGGKGIIKGVANENSTTPNRMGLVGGNYVKARCAQFWIRMSDSIGSSHCCLGDVVQGMDVLMAMIQHNAEDIKQVYISNCGIES